jgi:hypothetical protein
MPLNHTRTYLSVGLLLLLLATPSLGQGPQGLQIFALDDESTYGGGQPPKQGYFFSFDGLWWSISPPHVHPIGFPDSHNVSYGPNLTDVRTEYNTLDTSELTGQFSAGNRIEFGRVDDQNGWFVGIIQLRDQEQDYTAPAADIVFNDPANGPVGQPLLVGNVNVNPNSTPPNSPPVFAELPTTFSNVFVQEIVQTWGVEANYLHRFLTRHGGGTFEMFLGARYFNFKDTFNVATGPDPGGLKVPEFLAQSYWDTQAQNSVVGPQIGLRWFKKQGRWTFTTEGRFLAGINFQNLYQTVDFGPTLNPGVNSDGSYTPFEPTRLAHSTATYVERPTEFAPAIELRIEWRYQITRSIAAHAGWTGFWMDGIARGSSIIDYTTANTTTGGPLGINLADNKESLFLTGLTLGFDINR